MNTDLGKKNKKTRNDKEPIKTQEKQEIVLGFGFIRVHLGASLVSSLVLPFAPLQFAAQDLVVSFFCWADQ
jgi:hypothetical protein